MRLAPHWRLREQRYRLKGEICECCGKTVFPLRDICPVCNRETGNIKVSIIGVESGVSLYEAAQTKPKEESFEPNIDLSMARRR